MVSARGAVGARRPIPPSRPARAFEPSRRKRDRCEKPSSRSCSRRCSSGLTATAASATVTCSSGVEAIPTSYLSLYKRGARRRACPGRCSPPSARSSPATARTRARSFRTTGACSGRCSSRPARTGSRGSRTARAIRGSGARGGSGAPRRATRRTAWTIPTTRSPPRPRSCATTPGPSLDWTRALYHYNALGAYVNLVLRRERQYRARHLLVAGDSSSTAASGVRDAGDTAMPRRRAPRRRSCSTRRPSIWRPPRRPTSRSGIVDSRLVALLAWIAAASLDRDLRVPTGHPKFVAGTSKISNNWYGRGDDDHLGRRQGRLARIGGGARALARARGRRRRRSARARSARPGPTRRTRATTLARDALHLIHIGFDGPTQR